MIVHGDCLDVMAGLEPGSVAAVVTDPPYDLTGHRWDSLGDAGKHSASRQRGGFMGKAWDGTGVAFRSETWALALAVAKPGAHLLAFGGTRTVHRMTVAIEDAGWEIRDCLVWGYASGFPKSHNLDGEWDGWGTALKPAWEPIVMARKPLRGTVAANVGLHGTGAINIDGTRIVADDTSALYVQPRPTDDANASWSKGEHTAFHYTRTGEPSASRRYADEPGDFAALPGPRGGDPAGRWPANVILTDPIFDGGIAGVVRGGETISGKMLPTVVASGERTVFGQDADAGYTTIETYGDSGTYSRFFLIPKADRAEREPVGSELIGRVSPKPDGRQWDIPGSHSRSRRNVHPTVKPVDLMRHLVRLVTPPGGTVLDPFLGSGTTGIACEMEGFDWIGIEKEAEYVAIAEARLVGVQRGFGLSA